MATISDTLSERIGTLADDADQLLTEIKKLRREINERDGIESINHLADVPGDLLDAEDHMRKVAVNLSIAADDATKGGE